MESDKPQKNSLNKMQFIKVKKAIFLSPYKLKVWFNTGESGIADMSDIIEKGIFRSLKNIINFKNFQVDENQNTIVWDNGRLDIAPESFYFRVFKSRKDLQEQFKKWGYLK